MDFLISSCIPQQGTEFRFFGGTVTNFLEIPVYNNPLSSDRYGLFIMPFEAPLTIYVQNAGGNGSNSVPMADPGGGGGGAGGYSDYYHAICPKGSAFSWKQAASNLTVTLDCDSIGLHISCGVGAHTTTTVGGGGGIASGGDNPQNGQSGGNGVINTGKGGDGGNAPFGVPGGAGGTFFNKNGGNGLTPGAGGGGAWRSGGIGGLGGNGIIIFTWG